jgi:putative endonuclease
MAQHNLAGNQGEELAAAYFAGNGYEIMHRNWRSGPNEIDIIARRGQMIHFIEVKYRSSTAFGPPEGKVTAKKFGFLTRAAEAFLFRHRQYKHVQFDILSITAVPGTPPNYFLIEDVYLQKG